MKRICIALAATALALPTTAAAHVTVNPSSAPAGSFAELTVRVPNERDDAATVKVDVKLPHGFVIAAYEPLPGWRVKVRTVKLTEPLETDDGPISEEVSRITWTGTGEGVGSIPPGAFKDFPLSVRVPGEAGDVLTFKALQTYSDGDVVRWIGAPDAEEPAPRLEVSAATGDHHGSAGAPVAAHEASDEDDAGDGLALAALIVAVLGLLAGGLALLRSRRMLG